MSVSHIEFTMFLIALQLGPYFALRKRHEQALTMLIIVLLLVGPVIISLSPGALAGEPPAVP